MKTYLKHHVSLIVAVGVLVAIGVPACIESMGICPGLNAGDWLDFWGQYLGTLIALIGSSIIAIYVATSEIRSTLVMQQIQERVDHIFEVIELVSNWEYYTEFPIFRITDSDSINTSDWKEFILTINKLREFSGNMGLKLSQYRFKLPSDFVENLWNIIKQDGETQKRTDYIFKQSEEVSELIAAYPITAKENRNALENKINESIVSINTQIMSLRHDLIAFSNEGLKYIDKLEKMK